MKLDPAAVEIAEAKIRTYLLAPRKRNDKSGFLAQAGYTAENWKDLEEDVRRAVAGAEATSAGENPYGELFETEVNLPGRAGAPLRVRIIWFRPRGTDRLRLVTMIP